MRAILRSMGAIILGLAGAALAYAADPSGVAACRDIADGVARLACFDRATAAPAAIPAVPVAAPAPPLAPRAATLPVAPVPPPVASGQLAAPAPLLDPQQRFGLPEHKVVQKEVAAGTRDKDASKIHAQIVQLQAAPDRRMVFTLDNAQVWRQLMAEGDLLAKPGDTVTISRGLLGSYWLQAPSGRGSKVDRLR